MGLPVVKDLVKGAIYFAGKKIVKEELKEWQDQVLIFKEIEEQRATRSRLRIKSGVTKHGVSKKNRKA